MWSFPQTKEIKNVPATAMKKESCLNRPLMRSSCSATKLMTLTTYLIVPSAKLSEQSWKAKNQ